ncbi:MAG: DUF2203 domain-containing protein [Acidobacteria bacterium]|nr:DUF2203 domain-containing protein [Acidobacteriota bacterium]
MSTEEREERVFTLAEANSLLPRLRSILEGIGDVWVRVKELHPEIQKARDAATYDGYSPYGVIYVESVSHLMMLLQQIRGMGVHLKDLDKGLCDFPYMRNGRMVYLCWHLGEDAIEYWHDIEAGFAGREPLDATDR